MRSSRFFNGVLSKKLSMKLRALSSPRIDKPRPQKIKSLTWERLSLPPIKAANAAEKSADFSVRSLYTLDRPWVLVSDFEIRRDTAGALEIAYRVYNVGPLPATLRGRHAVVRVSEREPDDPEFAGRRSSRGWFWPPIVAAKRGPVLFHYRLTQTAAESDAESQNKRRCSSSSAIFATRGLSPIHRGSRLFQNRFRRATLGAVGLKTSYCAMRRIGGHLWNL